ncbi:uncharacterized protein LOC101852996 isoform X2 [Aplysia californica]|nr:uncharacterized protein LOC101852996 isoform X2 [Aplysia californica]
MLEQEKKSESKLCHKCNKALGGHPLLCSCSATTFRYCCLKCLSDDDKCWGACHRGSVGPEMENTNEESSENNHPSWTDIKKRAKLLTPLGNFRPSLLDPAAYVLREGMAAFQNASESELSRGETMQDAVCSNNVETPMEVSRSECVNRGDVSSSDDLNVRSLHRASNSSVEVQSSLPPHSRSTASTTVSASDCGPSTNSCESLLNQNVNSNESLSNQNVNSCESLPEQNMRTGSRNLRLGEGSRLPAATNICTPRGPDGTSSNANSIDHHGTSFGRGWWVGGTSSERRGSLPQTRHDDGNDFGAGWWKGADRKSEASKGARSKKRNTSAPPSELRKRVRNNRESFGSGWWVGRLDKPKEESKHSNNRTNVREGAAARGEDRSSRDHSGRPTSGCDKSKERTTSSALVRGESERDEPVLDLVPYQVQTNPSVVVLFLLQVTLFKKHLLDIEEAHGRSVYTVLSAVPGLWRASLGGSKCSLLVQVLGMSSELRNAVCVRDIQGHMTMVLFPFLRLDEETPGMGRDSTSFVFLRAVHWTQLFDGQLVIMMEHREDVLPGRFV